MTVITPSRHRPRRAFGADARPQSAFTLAELLVSSGILALIGVVLVGLLKGGLDLWHRGESNRDLFERAAVVFDVLARDLATAAVDRGEAPPLPLYRALPETVSGKTLAGEKGLPGRPGFFCGRDRHGRPVLRFTRLRRPGEPAAPAPVPASAPTEDAPAPAGPVAPPDAREAAAALAALGGGVRDYM
ncbi:MAG: hypothetical protein HZA54_14870, partial [Planctomycetes bacterium]|nr:hypothetical protein [Planctomycetota bacterium]